MALTVLSGGQVLSGHPPALMRADVLLEEDRIVGIGPTLAVPSDARRIDTTGRASRGGIDGLQ